MERPFPVSEQLKENFSCRLFIRNCGYTRETAEAAIQSRHADMISFGRPIISNPDLVERFSNGWPLNPQADMKVWYSFDAAGYTDFPRYGEPVEES